MCMKGAKTVCDDIQTKYMCDVMFIRQLIKTVSSK